MKLKEGKSYRFKNLKTVFLPDGEENIILEGPDGLKYLLPVANYSNYSLSEKSEFKCRIDRINCTGKVFLEPEHPFYKEGLEYEFIVANTPDLRADEGKGIVSIVGTDGSSFEVPVSLLENAPDPGSRIKLPVKRISKGKLFFTELRNEEKLVSLPEGGRFEFRITGTVTGKDMEEYYTVTDTYGGEHLLKRRYYRDYGFSNGSVFRGTILRSGPEKQLKIEPDNPWYRTGDILDLTVTSVCSSPVGDGYMVDACDRYGTVHRLECKIKPQGNSLRSRVIRLKKGKPLLVITDD